MSARLLGFTLDVMLGKDNSGGTRVRKHRSMIIVVITVSES